MKWSIFDFDYFFYGNIFLGNNFKVVYVGVGGRYSNE